MKKLFFLSLVVSTSPTWAMFRAHPPSTIRIPHRTFAAIQQSARYCSTKPSCSCKQYLKCTKYDFHNEELKIFDNHFYKAINTHRNSEKIILYKELDILQKILEHKIRNANYCPAITTEFSRQLKLRIYDAKYIHNASDYARHPYSS